MQRMKDLRPVWAEVNLDNLRHNIQEVRRVVNKSSMVCAVIKADGYGHGAAEIAKTLLENGADRLAVATLSEGMELRQKGFNQSLLILGYTPEEQGQHVLDYNLIQTVYNYQQAEALSKIAKSQNKDILLHIKIDTGMSRLGLQADEASINIIQDIYKLPNVIVEGIYTHFALADEVDKSFTWKQYNLFMELINALEERGIIIPIKHVSNSAAIIDLPEMNLDMVRAGIMLYGLYPSKDVSHEAVKLKQVMTLKARVSHVKKVEADRGISYGHIYKTTEEKQIITLPIGYADGFTRMLTNKATVTLKGRRLPVVGRICMDQCMVDASDVEVMQGDDVVIFGENPKLYNTVDDVAEKLGTINYEIVCMIGKRVPRVYMENNNLLHIKDSLLK